MVQKQKVLLVGLFEYKLKNIGGGEVTKPRNIKNYLEKKLSGSFQFSCFDFYSYRHRPLAFWISLSRRLSNNDICFIFPSGPKGALFFFTFFRFYLRRHNIRVFYPVVGGWVGEFLGSHPKCIETISKFSGCFCETHGLCSQLQEFGLKNIFYSPVFSSHSPISDEDFSKSVINEKKADSIRLCTFSRISKEKGVELAIQAVIKYNETVSNNQRVFLDLYGRGDPGYMKKVTELASKGNGFVSLRGQIPDQGLIILLSSYYACLFPTFFFGEGFPATVLECFLAGLPVFGSNWLYNSEIIIPQKTGLLYEPNNVDAIVSAIKWSVNHRDCVIAMRSSCLDEGSRFAEEKCMQPIVDQLNLLTGAVH